MFVRASVLLGLLALCIYLFVTAPPPLEEEGAVEELEFSWEVASPEGGTRPLRFSTALFPPLRGTALDVARCTAARCPTRSPAQIATRSPRSMPKRSSNPPSCRQRGARRPGS